MTVLRHALCGDDFDQTPVSIIFSEKCSKLFSGFVGDATQVQREALFTFCFICICGGQDLGKIRRVVVKHVPTEDPPEGIIY